ncbi:PIG-L deacetylase family protein [Campylobacter sp. US33a]|uniref:PIG-L deacetylase family protein n=1 Tax=Campylobacter sp. US33a TaxID=2498120 RepID=UPI0010681750|nr:PIG-L family deacetylase [Campylobacter sp. US33a]TEY02798.1 PIG-L family deacetylase [Campylobacter sp. US33a]
MNKKVLVVATHYDDETLGAGGTLLKHKNNNDEIYCVFCTSASQPEYEKNYILKKEEQIKQICEAYNFNGIYFLGLKPAKVDIYKKGFLVQKMAEIFAKIEPNIVYLPFAYDVHSDHRIIFEIAFSCTKSFRYPSIERVLMMETLSESEFAPALANQSFIPNVFVDISEFFEKKCEIMQIYESELGAFPFPRSLENMKALAQFRACTYGGGL